ncbi:hypothetical protein LCGC14_0914770 [marine sediment metagenome]|uniref:Uncharacterized protein n=1 Tax=marine sediment metagenome TaxID=412755 RepID=A0A0F9RZ96_9ZZZZ
MKWFIGFAIYFRNGCHLVVKGLSWWNPFRVPYWLMREAIQLFLVILFPNKMLNYESRHSNNECQDD